MLFSGKLLNRYEALQLIDIKKSRLHNLLQTGIAGQPVVRPFGKQTITMLAVRGKQNITMIAVHIAMANN